MSSEVLALLAATCYSAAQIVSKLGSTRCDTRIGLFASLLAGTVSTAGYALANVADWAPPLSAVIFFAVGGILGSGLGRLLLIKGIAGAGASVAVPLSMSVQPVVATFAGAFFFSERILGGSLAAVGAIVAGVWLSARSGTANRIVVPLEAGVVRPTVAVRPGALPLLAGCAYAAADIIRKAALQVHADPVLGALIGLVSAVVVWFAFTAIGRPSYGPVQRGTLWFCLHGVLSALAQVLVLHALLSGSISIVSPIVAAQPVIVVVLSALFLRRLEVLRLPTVIGSVIVFGAVVYLSLT